MIVRAFSLILLWLALVAGAALLLSTGLPWPFLLFVVVGAAVLAAAASLRRGT